MKRPNLLRSLIRRKRYRNREREKGTSKTQPGSHLAIKMRKIADRAVTDSMMAGKVLSSVKDIRFNCQKHNYKTIEHKKGEHIAHEKDSSALLVYSDV